MKYIWIALILGFVSSCASYMLLNFNLPLAYVFNPFIVYYFDFDTSGGNQFGTDLVIGILNVVPFLFFGILLMSVRKWTFGLWLVGALGLMYLGWIVSHFFLCKHTIGGSIEDSVAYWRIFIGFAGGLHDRDLAFVCLGWRDCDTFTSRWIAPDPMGDAGDDSRGNVVRAILSGDAMGAISGAVAMMRGLYGK